MQQKMTLPDLKELPTSRMGHSAPEGRVSMRAGCPGKRRSSKPDEQGWEQTLGNRTCKVQR